LVISNLKRLCQIKKARKSIFPEIEVQFLKYQHNINELPQARQLFKEIGVNKITDFWGHLHNEVEMGLENIIVNGPAKRKNINCLWPYYMMVIKYNGEAIPCCNHRSDELYNKVISSPSLGNVLNDGVLKIWNNLEYIKLRNYINNIDNYIKTDYYKECFCYGCYRVVDSNAHTYRRSGETFLFDDLYYYDNHKKLRRK
jgi:hypothetical protein